MTTLNNFDDIKNFFSSYFHEDWPLEAQETAQIISLYLAQGGSAKELHGQAEQLMHFIDMYKNDEELERALFSELGCYYQPSADNISARLWLQAIVSSLQAAADDGRA